MKYNRTLSSACEFASQNRLEEWVHAYLLSDGKNKGLSDGLKLFERYYIGPVKMPLSLFERCTGPEENMKWRVHKEVFERRVADLGRAINEGSDMPPLIVHYLVDEDREVFELNDGNHRYEAYMRLGIKECHVIVWITEESEYTKFCENYLKYLE